MRNIEATPTMHNGIRFRSLTEAKWSAFLLALGVKYEYEPKREQLSTGGSYLPDFYIPAWNAYLEVKPANEEIQHAERQKIEQFCLDNPGPRFWVSFGAPVQGQDYFHDVSDKGNEWCPCRITEDRRNEGVYWIVTSFEGNPFAWGVLGGWGTDTNHDKLPLDQAWMNKAYLAAASIGRFAA